MNKLIYTALFICFTLFSVSGQILINEYSAANYDTYADNYAEYEDWIELYNPTSSPIDINGWALTDKPSNPSKWLFPSSFIIPANGLAVVYCSGRDELIGSNAHTNFKITQTKGNEVFMISDASGVFQDSIKVLPNQKTHTRGRETDGAANWSVFISGTPNASNFGAMEEYATTPIFSQSGGYNNTAVNLTLSSPDPNISIYYTNNGDEPDISSTPYNSIPINITSTSVIKAIAYSSNGNIPPSFIDFHTFFINDMHTIPILSIAGDQVDNLLNGNQIEPEGTMEWFDSNGILLDKGTGEYNKHGNDSWAYNQRGFDYVMRDQFGYNYALQDKLFDTKSRDKFQRIIVKAAANDNYPFSYGGSGAHIRDAYVNHLSQLGDLRVDERSTSSCILYLNGEYWGVYEVREKVDDTDFLSYYYDQDEINRGSADYLQFLKTWGGTWTKYGDGIPGPGSIALNDWDDFVDFVAANPMNNQVNYLQAKSQYNMGSLIDYFLLNSYVVCQDWLNYNTAWWRGLDPNGEKKKWRYTLWDMDNTFDHGTNYTGIPSSSPSAEPCDASTLGNSGGQGHVPIWNEMLTNQEFHDDYINRWQDLANGPLSCTFMIHILDSMIGVIEPEMPRQIATWGGTYSGWENNVTDLRNWILARCDSMNSGFVDCDTAITGIFDVTVEIIGNGEVEMSNSNIINDLNTPWNDQRFGGIDLPFKVVSGPFDRWEIISTNTYVFDPNVDTLVLDLQSDVIVQAYFIPPTPTRDITYNIIPSVTATNITVDGVLINTFPTSINYIINETVNISANIDPLYRFSTWESDSVVLTPTATSPIISFSASNNDTVTLYLYKKPTIIYDIFPTGTTTTIDINAISTSAFPTSAVYYNNENITLTPNIDPLYSFVSWDYDSITMSNGNSEVNSFVSAYNDTVKLVISLIPPLSAFISGDQVVCDNSLAQADVEVSFAAGFPPYTFIYAIDGITQSSITTNDNPYYIQPKQSGVYTLTYFSDAISSGSINGSALVTVLESPTALFATASDTLSVLYPSVQLNDISLGNIVAWNWDFGDNTPNDFTANPYHVFRDSIGIYQLNLIVTDDFGCSDTTFKQLWVADDYWMYIPNSFTPDYDGINDLFCLTHHGIREATFYFNVYDRSSNLVYATENIADLECFLNANGWDGKHYKTGNDLPMGTYIYEVYFQDFEGWKHQDKGRLFIIR